MMNNYCMLKESHSARAALSKQIIENYKKSNTFDDSEEMTNDESIVARKYLLNHYNGLCLRTSSEFTKDNLCESIRSRSRAHSNDRGRENRSSDMIRDMPRQKHKSISALKLHKKKHRKHKAKKETRIKKFNDMAVQSKSKRKLQKRRKIKNSHADQENNKNMINIKTQNKEVSHHPINNISFAYDSIDITRPKQAHEESTDVKCSTSKFPLHEHDQSGGDKSAASALLKKRMKVRKISLCIGNKLQKKKLKKAQVVSGNGTSTKKKRKKSPKAKKPKVVEKEDEGDCNMPLQMDSKLKGSFQIDDIIKDTIKKRYQDKINKQKEEEQK